MTDPDPPPPRPPLAEDAHKGDAGRALCLVGSRAMPGAAILVARAAQRSGAGLVTVACFDDLLLEVIPPPSPETVLLPVDPEDLLDHDGDFGELVDARESHARLAGPGLGNGERTRLVVRRLLESAFSGPLVLDADALNALEGEPERLRDVAAKVVITPHPGEASRLAGRAVPRDDAGRSAFAEELARRAGCVVLLKGRHTVITDGQRTELNDTGNSGMATAGSGDVLGGILVAFLARAVAQGDAAGDAFASAWRAARVHGIAGDYAAGMLGADALIASDLIAFLPQALQAS